MRNIESARDSQQSLLPKISEHSRWQRFTGSGIREYLSIELENQAGLLLGDDLHDVLDF